MSDHAIAFSGRMARALVEGRKSQTRQIVKHVPPQPAGNCHPKSIRKRQAAYLDSYCSAPKAPSNPRGMSREWCWWQVDDRQCLPTFNVKYQPGDRLWVREPHKFRGANYGAGDEWFRVWGSAGGTDSWDPDFPFGFEPGPHDRVQPLCGAEHDEGDGVQGLVTKQRPGIHMPRWASRLTLSITDVRVERLQAISEADAVAEGYASAPNGWFPVIDVNRGLTGSAPDGRSAFAMHWNLTHGPGAWDANPWVTTSTFSVAVANIDKLDPK